MQRLRQTAILPQSRAALIAVVLRFAQNIVQGKVEGLVTGNIHEIQGCVIQRLVHQIHRSIVEEEIDGGGEVHFSRIGEHVVDDGTVGDEIHTAQFRAHIDGTATMCLAIVGIQDDDIARHRRIHQFLFGGRLEFAGLLVVGDIAEHVDVFRIVEFVLCHAECSVNTTGFVARSDGHHHFTLVHVLGAIVYLQHDIVGIHLLQNLHAGVLDAVAAMNNLHAAEIGEERVGAVQFRTTIEGELVAEVEIFLQRNLRLAESLLHEIDRVKIEGLHALFGINVIVIAIGIELCGTLNARGTVVQFVEFVLPSSQDTRLLQHIHDSLLANSDLTMQRSDGRITHVDVTHAMRKDDILRKVILSIHRRKLVVYIRRHCI